MDQLPDGSGMSAPGQPQMQMPNFPPQQPPGQYGVPDMQHHMQQQMGAPPGQSPQVTLMLVNVPPNVRGGMEMVVMTPTGQQYMVVVPQGAGPGSQFQIAVPRTDSVMPGYQPGMVPGMGHPGMGGMHPGMMQNPAMQMAGARAAANAAASFDGRGGGRGGGRGRGRKRKERDVNRAPRQPSAYNLFMKTEVARIKQIRPDLTHKEAFKEAARNWGVSEANPQRRARTADDSDTLPPLGGNAEGGATEEIKDEEDGMDDDDEGEDGAEGVAKEEDGAAAADEAAAPPPEVEANGEAAEVAPKVEDAAPEAPTEAPPEVPVPDEAAEEAAEPEAAEPEVPAAEEAPPPAEAPADDIVAPPPAEVAEEVEPEGEEAAVVEPPVEA